MQDIEFTIENGKLYLLQTRNGKRTAKAAIKIAVDLVHEQLITREEAVSKVEVKSIDQLLHPNFNEESLKQATVVSKMGLPASPGAATGKVVFSAEIQLLEKIIYSESTYLMPKVKMLLQAFVPLRILTL